MSFIHIISIQLVFHVALKIDVINISKSYDKPSKNHK